MRLLLLGYGNPGRGDDGLGPALVEAVAGKMPNVTAQTAVQLQLEHVLDVAAHDLVLLVDAGVNTPPPFVFERLYPWAREGRRLFVSAFSHALTPGMLLSIYQETLNASPPLVFLLTVAGERFDFGEGLSVKAQQNLSAALVLVESLLSKPELECWEQACTSSP